MSYGFDECPHCHRLLCVTLDGAMNQSITYEEHIQNFCSAIPVIQQMTFGDHLYLREADKWGAILLEIDHQEDYENVCHTLGDIEKRYTQGYYERLFAREKETQVTKTLFQRVKQWFK